MSSTVLLGDICDVRDGTHDSPKPSSNGMPLVTSKHLKNNQINLGDTYLISQADYEAINKRSKVDKNDLLISMIGTVGELVLIRDDPDFAIKNIGLIKTGDELLGKYLYYYLQSPKAKSQLQSMLAGSTQKFISLGLLRKFPVDLPGNEFQRQATEILSSLDEKIELNRRMNKTLEAIGQALFKHWFIDYPEKETWPKGMLKDLVRKVNEPLKSGEHLVDRIYLPVDCLQMKSLSVLEPLNSAEAKSSLIGFEKDDILVGAMRVYFHRVNIPPKQGVTRTTTFVLRPKQSNLKAFAALLINQDETIEYASTHSKGTTMPYAVWENGLANLTIRIPPDNLLNEFQRTAWPMLEIVRDSQQTNQTLSQLRDSLLPRLMSGNISTRRVV